MNNSGTIMVVEDTLESLQFLTRLLAGEGYQVRPADSGELALASVAASPPDLILLDILMPGIDGFEVIRRLKKQEQTRDIPVIFLSAVKELDQRVLGLNLGAVDFISKPVQREELLARVRTHMELCRLRTRAEKQAGDLRQANDQLLKEIAERKTAEDALKQANSKLNLLSSITRHDINNQIFSLKSFLELSKESLNDAAKTAEYISKEERAADAIERQIIFTREYQDLGVKAPVWQCVEQCIQKALAVLPVREIRVVAEIRDLEVYADPLFEKVFYNLIDNALRYGGQGMTEIRITSQDTEHGLVISVDDDGAGIPADDKKRLFERGFGHNTGLGLFLSREILSITRITITETGKTGNGARFEILVPKGGYRFMVPGVMEGETAAENNRAGSG